jgi:hypothetical protein
MLRADSNRQRSDFGRELLKVKVAERRKYEAQSKVSEGRALEACMYSGCTEAETKVESESFRKDERLKDSSSCEVNGARHSDGSGTAFDGALSIGRSDKLFFSIMPLGRDL